MDDGAWLALVNGPHARQIKQGAEAKVYCVDLWMRAPQLALPNRATSACVPHTERVLIKHRFFKRYRHPALSISVTASRTISEARALVRCARHGVHVPRLVCVDETRGILGMEWIEGPSIRQWLGGLPEDGEDVSRTGAPSEDEQDSAMVQIGEQLAQMHWTLLNDLLAAIEGQIATWRTQSTAASYFFLRGSTNRAPSEQTIMRIIQQLDLATLLNPDAPACAAILRSTQGAPREGRRGALVSGTPSPSSALLRYMQRDLLALLCSS